MREIKRDSGWRCWFFYKKNIASQLFMSVCTVSAEMSVEVTYCESVHLLHLKWMHTAFDTCCL